MAELRADHEALMMPWQLAVPMSATIIDGKAVAAGCAREVARDVAAFVAAHGRPPGLATILVGDDPASAVYVGGKQKASRRGRHRRLPPRPAGGRRHARTSSR